MFFKQIYRNAAKNRKENGLFFGSLVIAIVAFYTLLSLGEQDVMRFLATIESDAVGKLMRLLPVVYMISLFFVFFLVYFACKYQMDNRRKEFGMYLMLGMKRSRLFALLFGETLWSSLVSLVIGLPVAIFLTEGISLATAKFVGLGIIEHRFSISPKAIVWTICGYVLVQLLSMLLICIPLGRTEPAKLLKNHAADAQTELSKAKSSVVFIIGVILMLAAYYLGIFQLYRLDATVLLLIVFGIAGTFLVYRGLGGFLGKRIQKKAADAKGLEIFTGRQVQENVIHQNKALAIASLLLMVALTCMAYGIVLANERTTEARSVDVSVFCSEEEFAPVGRQPEIKKLVKTSYPMKISRINADIDKEELVKRIRAVKGSRDIGGESMAENIAENMHVDYIISESAYNCLLQALGKEKLDLSENQIALYSSMSKSGEFPEILNHALKEKPSIQINGRSYRLVPQLYDDNVVADRAVTLYAAFIVKDELFEELTSDMTADTGICYQNLHLKDEAVEEAGLLQAIQKTDALLADSGLEYETFLAGIGRNLFYTVTASYLTIYLGVLFLLIANTVIGMKYLIGQRQNKHRYVTLLMLGTDMEELCISVKKQIKTFFAMVLLMAIINSGMAVSSLFLNLTKQMGDTPLKMAGFAGIVLLVFVGMELIYIRVVTKNACREICSLEIEEGRNGL